MNYSNQAFFVHDVWLGQISSIWSSLHYGDQPDGRSVTTTADTISQGDLFQGFFPFFWGNLKGLQLFLRCFDVSQNRPEARACWSQISKSSSSSIISASKSQGYLLELDLWFDFSNPTMFTWKLGRWVFGLQAIPCTENFVCHLNLINMNSNQKSTSEDCKKPSGLTNTTINWINSCSATYCVDKIHTWHQKFVSLTIIGHNHKPPSVFGWDE